MYVKNNLKKILLGLGIKSLVPTEQVLSEQLAGMTMHRFNKLLNNVGPKEIQLHEVHVLVDWLSQMTGKPKTDFKLVETSLKLEETIPC